MSRTGGVSSVYMVIPAEDIMLLEQKLSLAEVASLSPDQTQQNSTDLNSTQQNKTRQMTRSVVKHSAGTLATTVNLFKR